jgi:hypothetical protein
VPGGLDQSVCDDINLIAGIDIHLACDIHVPEKEIHTSDLPINVVFLHLLSPFGGVLFLLLLLFDIVWLLAEI